MLLRIIKAYRDLVVICDSNLLGKRFSKGKFQLNLKESFYQGEEVSEEEVIKILKAMAKEDATFNIVGRQAVETAVKAGVLEESEIRKIKNIPFALILL